MIALQLPARNSAVDFREHGYVMEEFVGKGQFGLTYKVRYEKDSSIWLAKSIDLASLDEKDKLLSLQEAAVMQTLNHPGIVSWRESFVHHDMFLIIIMEFCEQGDLFAKMDELRDAGEYLSEESIVRTATQLSEALRYIHSRNILHRDIKPSNIFLTENGDVKIGDFGISRLMTTTLAMAHTAVGTPQYMSPEMCESKPYTYKSDVWALGCVIYEAAALRNAFEADSFLALVWAIASKPPKRLPDHYSQDLQNLVDWLLTKDPDERPSAVQILSLPFIQKHRLIAAFDATSLEHNNPESSSPNLMSITDASRSTTEDWASRQLPADNAVTAAIGGGGRAVRRRSLCLVPPTHKARSTSNSFRPQQFQLVTARIKIALDNENQRETNRLINIELEDGEVIESNENRQNEKFLGHDLSEPLTIEVLLSIVGFANAHVSMKEMELVIDRLILRANGNYVIVGDLVRALDPLLWIDIHTTTLEWAREALDLEQMSPSEKREGYTLDNGFRQFDGHDCGLVSRSAFRAVFHIFFPQLSNGDLEDLYNFAPKTIDGHVLYQAFLHDGLQLPLTDLSPNTSLSSSIIDQSFRPEAEQNEPRNDNNSDCEIEMEQLSTPTSNLENNELHYQDITEDNKLNVSISDQRNEILGSLDRNQFQGEKQNNLHCIPISAACFSPSTLMKERISNHRSSPLRRSTKYGNNSHPLVYKSRLSSVAAVSSVVPSHCVHNTPIQLSSKKHSSPSTFNHHQLLPIEQPWSSDSIPQRTLYSMEMLDEQTHDTPQFPQRKRSSFPSLSPTWISSNDSPTSTGRSATPSGGRSALAAFGNPVLFPSTNHHKRISPTRTICPSSKQSPIREYEHPILILRQKNNHDHRQQEYENKNSTSREHRYDHDLSDQSTAAATSNSLGSNSTMLDLLQSPGTSISSIQTGHECNNTILSPSPSFLPKQRIPNFGTPKSNDILQPFPPMSIQLTNGTESHTILTSVNQRHLDMSSSTSHQCNAVSVSQTAIKFSSDERKPSLCRSSFQESPTARITPIANHMRNESSSSYIGCSSDFDPSSTDVSCQHETQCGHLRPNANRTHHKTAVEGRVEAATSMQFLLHHLQAERAASCRAAATAVPMNIDSIHIDREKALSRLLEHRTRTDDAASAARRIVVLSFHAQRALLDRVSAKEGSLFAIIIHDGCVLLNTLIETIGVHRTVVDQLCRRGRRSRECSSDEDENDVDDDSTDWSSAQSSVYPSEDEVVNVTSSDQYINDEMQEMLSNWSSRFLFVTEQLTTDISRLLAWLMHLVSALKNSPYKTFQKVNQLKELLSSQIAFIAARQSNEHLKADWDAARFFMGLVVARKSVAASLPFEEGKDHSKNVARELNAHQLLTDNEAKLLHSNADSESITSWRKSAISCVAKLQISAIRHLNDLQFDLQLDLDRYDNYHHLNIDPSISLSPIERTSRNLKRNSHQHYNNSQLSHRRRRRLSLPETLQTAPLPPVQSC